MTDNPFVHELNLIENAGLSTKLIAKILYTKEANILEWRDGKNLPTQRIQDKFTILLKTNEFWDENA